MFVFMSAKFQITDSEISVFPENESGCTFAEIINNKQSKNGTEL